MTDLDAHHVGITVSDLDTVLPFYRDVLGLDVVTRFSVSGEAFATGVGVEDVFRQVYERQEDYRLWAAEV